MDLLSYTDFGRFDSETIVFIHGLGSRKEAWEPQHELGDKYRIITMDLRGHGDTELDKDISMSNFAQDILYLLDYLSVESAVFCGLSLGGLVAQEIYKQSPERVKGLVLANTASYIDPLMASGVLWYGCKHHTDPNFVDKIVAKVLYDDKYAEAVKKTFLIRDCYMDAAKAPVGINYFPTLMTIDKPVLLFSSTEDKVVPSINQLWMYAACIKAPWIDRVMLANTGHLSNIEQAEQFNRAIEDFIEEAIR